MIEFREFNELLMRHVRSMTAGEKHLFVVATQRGEMWYTYLESFPEGTNEVFRERREFDCNCCHNFIRDLGNVVAIKDNKVVTIWDFETNDEKYQPVIDALAEKVREKAVCDVFMPTGRNFGTQSSVETRDDLSTTRWYHLHAVVDDAVKTYREAEVGTIRGQLRDSRNVLRRSLEEISPDALETVRDLISQGSLYKGEEWGGPLTQFHRLQEVYGDIEDKKERELFCWTASFEVGPAISRIKNHSIGVLLTDIAEGMDLNEAVKRYEKIVAPTNYKRPKAIFTKKMVADAQKTVKELGLEKSLGRRFARLPDITVNNILFANRDAAKEMDGDPFDELAESLPDNPKRLGKVEKMKATDFLKDVLPTVREMEVLLDNGHSSNMVSLIAPKDKDAKGLFKWGNAFSWAYGGNITDSMKHRVKAAGGKVDGDLRFSIQWNDAGDNNDDLDAHCIEVNGNHIHFRNKGRIHRSSGRLDVDIVNPKNEIRDGVAVENITWSDRRRMPEGVYKLGVHCYSSRGAKSGFTAEIEFDGRIYSFAHTIPLWHGQMVQVAEVTFDGKSFTLADKIPAQESCRDIWGLQTNKFHPVSALMYSPNYWDEQEGIGHRHYFFMLKGCKSDETPNGFFNEFLPEDLMKHKRVFEALGAKMRVEDEGDQLSGLGFSATKRASLTVRVTGSFTRVIEITF